MKHFIYLLLFVSSLALTGCQRTGVKWVLSNDRALLIDVESQRVIGRADEIEGLWSVSYPDLTCVWSWKSQTYTDLPFAMNAINKQCNVKGK